MFTKRTKRIGIWKPLVLFMAFAMAFVAAVQLPHQVCKAQDGGDAGEVDVINIIEFSKSNDWRFLSVKLNCTTTGRRNICLYYEELVEIDGMFFTVYFPSPTLITTAIKDNGDDRSLIYSTPNRIFGGCFMFLYDPVTGERTTPLIYFYPT